MSETIFRVEKNAENPYVMIDKNIFEDTSLSFKAKGILGYLLSRPNDWTLIVSDIQKRSTDGKDSVKNGIDELIERGYIVKTEQPRQAGKFATCDYTVYEKPVNSNASRCGKTVAEKPLRFNRCGKSATTNNNKLSNDLLNKNTNVNDFSPSTESPVILDADKSKEKPKPDLEKEQADELINYWNSHVDTAKQVKPITWISKIKGRLKNYSLDEIKQAMDYVINNQWYQSNNQVLIKNIVSSNERLETVLAKSRQSSQNQGQSHANNQSNYQSNATAQPVASHISYGNKLMEQIARRNQNAQAESKPSDGYRGNVYDMESFV